MYEFLGRSAQRPWPVAPTGARGSRSHLAQPSDRLPASPMILHMQENRSHLPQGARVVFTMLPILFIAVTLLTAARGQWLVPAYALAALAALTFALEHHAKAKPASETLEISRKHARHRIGGDEAVTLPTTWLLLVTEQRSPTDLRLILRAGERRIEIGRCLALEERRALAPLLQMALAQAKGS